MNTLVAVKSVNPTAAAAAPVTEAPTLAPVVEAPGPRADETNAEWLTEPAAFEGLREEWNALLADSAADCLFLTWEWLHTWWKHLAHERRLLLLTVRRGGQLIGAAALTLRRRRLAGWVSAPCLEFMGSGSVGSDYLDLVLRRGCEAEAAAALARLLVRHGSMLHLVQMPRQSAGDLVAVHLRKEGWSVGRAITAVCPWADLRNHTWESYLATLGAEHRYNVGRRTRSLRRRYAVSFDSAATDDERREALSVLFALHHLRWRDRGGSTAFHTPALIAFHQAFSQVALERGWLRLFLLRLDGAPVAALYAFRYGRIFYFYQSGFDPRYLRDSLGLVCTGLSIRRAIEEGAEEYDMLHGDEAYKFHWAYQVRELERLEAFPSDASGTLWKQAVTLSRSARGVARRVLPRSVFGWLATHRRTDERRG